MTTVGDWSSSLGGYYSTIPANNHPYPPLWNVSLLSAKNPLVAHIFTDGTYVPPEGEDEQGDSENYKYKAFWFMPDVDCDNLTFDVTVNDTGEEVDWWFPTPTLSTEGVYYIERIPDEETEPTGATWGNAPVTIGAVDAYTPIPIWLRVKFGSAVTAPVAYSTHQLTWTNDTDTFDMFMYRTLANPDLSNDILLYNDSVRIRNKATTCYPNGFTLDITLDADPPSNMVLVEVGSTKTNMPVALYGQIIKNYPVFYNTMATRTGEGTYTLAFKPQEVGFHNFNIDLGGQYRTFFNCEVRP
jgi:hypothetical protein